MNNGFAGFPKGKVRVTPIPNLFFSELLPYIDNIDELKLTLHCFWLLSRKEGKFRYITLTELNSDQTLLNGFEIPGQKSLNQSIQKACARGTLLQASIETDSNTKEIYLFINTGKGRSAIQSIKKGEWIPGNNNQTPISVTIETTNIFIIYEQNIGALTPIIAEQLIDAEKEFSTQWIKEAIKLAAENNARSWSYIDAILKRWQREGKGQKDGKSRRDTEKTRKKYLEYLDN